MKRFIKVKVKILFKNGKSLKFKCSYFKISDLKRLDAGWAVTIKEPNWHLDFNIHEVVAVKAKKVFTLF